MAGSPGSGEDPDFAHCMGVVFKVGLLFRISIEIFILKTIASV